MTEEEEEKDFVPAVKKKFREKKFDGNGLMVVDLNLAAIFLTAATKDSLDLIRGPGVEQT